MRHTWMSTTPAKLRREIYQSKRLAFSSGAMFVGFNSRLNRQFSLTAATFEQDMNIRMARADRCFPEIRDVSGEWGRAALMCDTILSLRT